MRGSDRRSGELFSYEDVERRIRRDHPLRSIRGVVNEALDALSRQFAALYGSTGRPLYSAFTHYCGFKVNSGEHKLMGLAPYGEPRYVEPILQRLIDVDDDGAFRLNMAYFDVDGGPPRTNERFRTLFGGPEREPATPLSEGHLDLARSIQVVTRGGGTEARTHRAA